MGCALPHATLVCNTHTSRPATPLECNTLQFPRHMSNPSNTPPLLNCPCFGHSLAPSRGGRVTRPLSPSYAGARAPRGGVTRPGVVLTDLESPLDCQ